MADEDLDPAQQIAQLKSKGTRLDLTRPIEEIQAELHASLVHEGRYAENANLECSLKLDSGHAIWGGKANSCYTCPHYTEDRNVARSLLCALGRRQEDLLAEMRMVLAPEMLDKELVREYVRAIEPGAELAEAMLTGV